MNWKALLDTNIQSFIKAHEKSDLKKLALQKMEPSWPRILILDQIKSRQKAAKKLPSWLNHENIILPPPDLIEQASSEATARYKASLIKGNSFIDLTAGAGIDSLAFTNNFQHGHCIEKDKTHAEILNHNLKQHGKKSIKVTTDSAENVLKTTPTPDVIYIDPARRNPNQRGLKSFKDCNPDVTTLMPDLIKTKATIIIKASPMLDISTAIKELQHVTRIDVIEWNGECKEVLYHLTPNTEALPPENIPIHAVTINDSGHPIHHITFTRNSENTLKTKTTMPQTYLYEPGPAFLKSGAFKTIADHHGISKLHPHTHLYTSENLINDISGKKFKILKTYSASTKSLDTQNADIAVRNFPEKPEILRKKYKLKSNQNHMIFACTLHDESKALIYCQRV